MIQPLENAIVRAVTVKEGQAVKEGDVLVGLEIAGAGADVGRLTDENRTAKADVARLSARLRVSSRFTLASAKPLRQVAPSEN